MKVVRDVMDAATESTGAQSVSGQECRELVGQRLSGPLAKLFTELTGLPLHVLWHEPLKPCRSGTPAVLCPTARRALDSGHGSTVSCETCLKMHWDSTVLRTVDGRRFRGGCAAISLCVGLQVMDRCSLSLVLHARIRGEPRQTSGPPRACGPVRSAAGSHEVSAPQVSAAAFDRAESLLRLIVHDLQATLHARLAERELDTARLRSEPTGTDGAPRQNETTGRLLGVAATAPATHPDGHHARQIVQAMLDYIRAHYQHPMALKEVAASLGMNANYLSGMFHHAMGTTFHRYLDRVRMAKAEELLRDPNAHIRDVAKAVGYASPNHFRSVFKTRRGLSPRIWAERSLSAVAKACAQTARLGLLPAALLDFLPASFSLT